MWIALQLRRCVPKLRCSALMASAQQQPSSDFAAFRQCLQQARHVLVLSGAGISADSGIPTFRGEGGFWRKYQATDLATPGAFSRDPGLVWEFYHYRRELVLSKQPNKAHLAIVEFEKKQVENGSKELVVITQNIDELHQRAGSRQVIELHGSLFKTRCIGCGRVESNYSSPICEGLRGMGAPDADAMESRIAEDQLPRCSTCLALLRPHVVWFGENLDADVLEQAYQQLAVCDLCLVVGTSSVVYPAAMFAPQLANRGVPIAEFNLESTPATFSFQFHFCGPASHTLPKALLADDRSL